MTRWAMVADLERCVGCQTCTAACRHANATSPAVQWRKVLDIEAGSYPNVNRTFVPVGCQHCADPPCMHVCPSTATRQRADGIVTIDYDICIGCAYCDVACPYQARFKITKEDFAYGDEAHAERDRARGSRAPRRRAEMHVLLRPHRFRHRERSSARRRSARDAGLRQCLHRRRACISAISTIRTAMCRSCCNSTKISGCMTRSAPSRASIISTTRPRPLRRRLPPPALSGAPAGRIRTRGVEPWHQKHWDWKASGNFMCGGAGAGLFGFATIASFSGTPILLPGLVALALIALRPDAADVQDRPAVALPIRAAPAATLLDVARSVGRRRAVSARARRAMVRHQVAVAGGGGASGCCSCSARA